MASKFRLPHRPIMVDIAIAGMVALLIALVTVSFHAIRVSLANPVRSLRNQ